MIVNNNIRRAILDINKHLTNFKTAFLTSLLYGRLRYMLPMPWQMHKTNERRSLFYQTFEISLQLAILFIFLKLQTFSGATFSSRLGYCELLVLIFFYASYTIFPSGAYLTLYMRDCSHYKMRENKQHLSYGFP